MIFDPLSPQIKEWTDNPTTDKTTSLLNRQGRVVIPLVIVVYLLLMLLTGYNETCKVKEPFASWTSYYYFGGGFSFMISIAQQANKVLICCLQSRKCGRDDKSIYYFAAITIAAIAGLSSFLTFSRNYGGICRDVLGVETGAAQWSEWITCVPLMVYVAIAVDHKPYLSWTDCGIIGGIFVAISCGVVMNFDLISYNYGIFLFIFGTCASIGSNIAILYLKDEGSRNEYLFFGGNVVEKSDDEIVASIKKAALTRLMFFIFPSFPFVYLLRYYGAIDRDQLYVAFLLLSVIAKLLFVSALVEEQVTAMNEMKARILTAATANESRRTFLRYVFHELRIPLNTITMGIAVVEDRKGDCAEEALSLMTGAACLINKTLNDVLLLHAIEEGSLKLLKKPLHFKEVVKASMRYAQSLADKSEIVLKLQSPEEEDVKCPFLIGDRLRLENVIRSLFTNAIQSSSPRSIVTIKISMKLRENNIPKRRLRNLMSNISFPIPSQFPSDLQSRDDILSNSNALCPLSDNQPSPRNTTTFQNLPKDTDAIVSPPIVNSSLSVTAPMDTCNIEENVINDVRAQKFQLSSISESNSIDEANVVHNEEMRRMSTTSSSRKMESGRKSAFARKSSRVAASLPSVCEVTLLVIDQGAGMSKDDMNGLMQPYSQIRPDYSEQGRSSGLWLLLAREIIKLHDGEIVAASEVGLGSTFGFRIPFEIASPSEELSTNIIKSVIPSSSCLLNAFSCEKDFDSPQTLSPPSEVQTVNKRYLIVDDTLSNSKMLSMLLRGRNIEYDVANNGQNAVDIIRNQGDLYDFIFMDFTMPIMNGSDAVLALREHGYDRLIFGLTGNALNDDVSTFLSAGADCVVAKPLRASQLNAILRHTHEHGFRSYPNIKFHLESLSDQEFCIRYL